MSAAIRNAHDETALRAFWAFFEPIAGQLNAELREDVLAIPAFAEIARAMPPEDTARQSQRSMGIQRQAILEGRWDEYYADLTAQGAGYARMGIEFSSWFQVLAMLRDRVRDRIGTLAQRDLQRAALVQDGLSRFLDITMGTIGDAYLATKQEIIRDQQEAIREISTPVLQIRDQVLILPIVGVVDTHRARHIMEAVLKAIRQRRAKAVVMDVTGVPIVDSKVAKHLTQTCESARLMGAIVIITGISQDIAQTLVTIGVDLSSVRTLGDLQSGIEEVERLLSAPTLASTLASG